MLVVVKSLKFKANLELSSAKYVLLYTVATHVLLPMVKAVKLPSALGKST